MRFKNGAITFAPAKRWHSLSKEYYGAKLFKHLHNNSVAKRQQVAVIALYVFSNEQCYNSFLKPLKKVLYERHYQAEQAAQVE